MDNVECPFCGVHFEPHNLAATTHPGTDCVLTMYTMSVDQWRIRPHKKEQPAEQSNSDLLTFHLAGEIQWLRAIVEKLVINEPEVNYSIGYDAKGLADQIISGTEKGREGAGK